MTALAAPSSSTLAKLSQRAVMLAWFTVAWNVVEAVVALGAGAAANSSALIGFGLDSTIEVSSALVVLWHLRSTQPDDKEGTALRLIALSFFALAAWVSVNAVLDLAFQREPQASSVGIGLAVASLIVMPVLAVSKQRTGHAMGTATVVADAAQTWLCTSLSAVLLIGLSANGLFGWWWADPVAGLVIAAVAIREGHAAWRGEACCAVPVNGTAQACQESCEELACCA